MKTRYVLPVAPAFRRFLFSAGFSSLALTALGQVTPTTPVYPLPAPTNPDSVATGTSDPQQFATPSVVGMGPSKGLIFHYERVPRFNVSSDGQSVGLRDYNTDATKNARLVIKGYIPMLNHPHLKLILGVNYEREEFQFSNQPTGYELYDNIENKGLKTLGTQLAVIRPVNDVNWYIFRIKGELSGDYTSSELNVADYLRVSSEFLYGWKRSPTFSWGVGVQLGYTFGRFSPYPALLYNRTFNKRWGIEALFPARVTARYNASPRSLFFAGYSVDGLNYIVKLRTPLRHENTTLNSLELRETEVKFRARWEREIYDFLWFGVEGGYRYNYAFDAFDRTNDNRVKIIDSKLASAPYASLELFIVPPRKFLKRQ
ncbi:DUF6268 family outer membrane beta-barrel protein [Hymenobacter cellulosivorans]|uniref:DUF6268 family outer membrane beta-barrel protein n=1 Tax=Hymenobacter cellulosivorans TaxID=2932249 RepID=A0ABY4FAS5_9BACT|nr:DUF6268 family outer membrane beta-barrel protein [Hymenobacter cellulosivorans]UOQ53593.1 DUF6268 family outer membrane beta-barrel protein [Hymenobacter cellulosivorans]